MEQTFRFLESHWNAMLAPLTVMIATIIAGWAVRNAVFRSLRGWATQNKSKLDDVALDALRGPVMIWLTPGLRP